jgi:E3 ubiquitin-protein ligase HECTD3
LKHQEVLRELVTVCFISLSLSNLIGEVCVLEDMTAHLPVIEVRIEECRGENGGYTLNN